MKKEMFSNMLAMMLARLGPFWHIEKQIPFFMPTYIYTIVFLLLFLFENKSQVEHFLCNVTINK